LLGWLISRPQVLVGDLSRLAARGRGTCVPRSTPNIGRLLGRPCTKLADLTTGLLLHTGQDAHLAGNLRQPRIRSVNQAAVGDPDDPD
jgi:hypothetical protein